MITIIAARSRNRVIGRNGELPWKLSADLKRFRRLTTDNVVIMGRKTYESIGKPLSNRVNIVISRKFATEKEDVWTVNSFEKAIEIAKGWKNKEIFIIGGERVWKSALDSGVVNAIELTLVNSFIDDGDAFFPFTPPYRWTVVSEEVFEKDEKNEFDYAFLRYEKASEYPDKRPLLYLPAARFDNQASYMEEILNDGICPFCQNWLKWYHEAPVEYSTKHWVLTKNDNPYKGTLHDMLLIPKEHVENFDDLSVGAKKDFGIIISSTVEGMGLDFGAIGMRFGDMTKTGGSVAHLHAHIKVGDVENPDHQPVRFKMSSIPRENKTPDQF